MFLFKGVVCNVFLCVCVLRRLAYLCVLDCYECGLVYLCLLLSLASFLEMFERFCWMILLCAVFFFAISDGRSWTNGLLGSIWDVSKCLLIASCCWRCFGIDENIEMTLSVFLNLDFPCMYPVFVQGTVFFLGVILLVL